MTNAIIPNLIEIPTDRSSQIAAIGYDSDVSLLYVSFRRGGLYAYDQVTTQEFTVLMSAQSLGSEFAKNIKGKKPYKRLDTKAAPAKAEPQSPTLNELRKAPAKAATNLVPFRPTSTALAVDDKQTADLATSAREWSEKAKAMTITDVNTHEAAMKILVDLDTVKKRIVETWKPMKAAAFAAHRAVCDKESELLKPLHEADRQLRSRIGEYTYAQIRAAQEADERNRKQAEEEARQRSIRETEETALAAAEELMALGDPEGAEAVLEAPMPAPIRYDMPMPVRPEVAAVNGVGGSIAYEVTITDINAIPREYLVIDMDKTQAEIARRAKQANGRLQVAGCSIRETFATRRTGGRRA